MQKVKRGDIVALKEWGGIIGKVAAYNSRTLSLRWPESLLGDGRGNFVQVYSNVEPEDIVILSAEEAWECLTKIFVAYKKRVGLDRSEPVLWTVQGDPDKVVEEIFNKAKARENKTKRAR